MHGPGYRLRVLAAVDWVRWDPALGIEDSFLFGARVGFNFGRAIALQGYFVTASNVATDPARLPPPNGFERAAPGPELKVSSVGANLVLIRQRTLGAPFLRVGGGVVRFSPDEGSASNQLMLNVVGGLRLGFVGTPSWEVFVEDRIFRIDRFDLFTAEGEAAPEDPEVSDLRHNWVLGGALHVPLGGDPTDPGPGLAGAALAVEPFAGRLFAASGLGLPNQSVFGARGGIDFTRSVGARGYYWRGTNGGGREPVQSYGGELQFTLALGTGITPFVVAGAGRLDLESALAEDEQAPEVNQTTLILGAGSDVTFADRLRARIAVHDYILSGTDRRQVRSPDQLLHSPLVSVGLSIVLGGARPR